MNRIEELELTVQMLVDIIKNSVLTGHEELSGSTELEQGCDIAESVLLSFPCNCTQFSFPHKRNRECFRRYNGQTG